MALQSSSTAWHACLSGGRRELGGTTTGRRELPLPLQRARAVCTDATAVSFQLRLKVAEDNLWQDSLCHQTHTVARPRSWYATASETQHNLVAQWPWRKAHVPQPLDDKVMLVLSLWRTSSSVS